MKSEIQSSTRHSRQEQKTWMETRPQHTIKGFTQEMSCLQRSSQEAKQRSRAGGRQIYNIAQDKTKGPRSSLNGALVPTGRGCEWRPQVRLFRASKACWCPEGPAKNVTMSIFLRTFLCSNHPHGSRWVSSYFRNIFIDHLVAYMLHRHSHIMVLA